MVLWVGSRLITRQFFSSPRISLFGDRFSNAIYLQLTMAWSLERFGSLQITLVRLTVVIDIGPGGSLILMDSCYFTGVTSKK